MFSFHFTHNFLRNISFEENTFNASIDFQNYGDCSKLELVYRQDGKELTRPLFNCSESQTEIKNTSFVIFKDLDYGTQTFFRVKTYGLDQTTSESNMKLLQSKFVS